MANTGEVLTSGFMLAAADLSAYQYRFVRLNGSGAIAVCAAGERSLGPLQNKPAAGHPCLIHHMGVSKVEMAETCSEMDYIVSDANGRGVVVTDSYVDVNGASPSECVVEGEYVIALALEAATAANDRISILVVHLGAATNVA